MQSFCLQNQITATFLNYLKVYIYLHNYGIFHDIIYKDLLIYSTHNCNWSTQEECCNMYTCP